MDIVLAKTFLAIVEWGNFLKASEVLCVTQSTVSTRVKLLEDMLGQPVFVRSRAGASLTYAGTKFKPFAEKLVQTWEQAQQEVGLPEEFQARLAVGVQFTLWELLMVRWLPWMRSAIPDYAISIDVGSSSWLMQQVVDGMLDLIITYTPQNRTGLVVKRLMVEELVLVSTREDSKGPWEEGYVFVDWGPEFRMNHATEFSEKDTAIVSTTYGPLALQYILENGGSAYLPTNIAHPHIEKGKLHLVNSVPSFERPVYSVHLEDEEGGARFDAALKGLAYVAQLSLGKEIDD